MPTLTVELPLRQSLTRRNLARWAEIVSDPRMARLPERVETDRFGRIIMSPPPSAQHGSLQFKIGLLLKERLQAGRVITECPISTADGVKAADVAWASQPLIDALGNDVCFSQAPDICVEVISPGNTEAEINEKTALYFDAGAVEVWHCDSDGHMRFLEAKSNRALPASKLCAEFPLQVTL